MQDFARGQPFRGHVTHSVARPVGQPVQHVIRMNSDQYHVGDVDGDPKVCPVTDQFAHPATDSCNQEAVFESHATISGGLSDFPESGLIQADDPSYILIQLHSIVTVVLIEGVSSSGCTGRSPGTPLFDWDSKILSSNGVYRFNLAQEILEYVYWLCIRGRTQTRRLPRPTRRGAGFCHQKITQSGYFQMPTAGLCFFYHSDKGKRSLALGHLSCPAFAPCSGLRFKLTRCRVWAWLKATRVSVLD